VNVTLCKTTGGFWRELNIESLTWRVKMEEIMILFTTMLGSLPQFIGTVLYVIYTVGGIILIPFLSIGAVWLSWQIVKGVTYIAFENIFRMLIWIILKFVKFIKNTILLPKSIYLLLKHFILILKRRREKV
jgi:hypothetical protein